jgi:ATP-binding cassette, subfamily B, bacterial PglK
MIKKNNIIIQFYNLYLTLTTKRKFQLNILIVFSIFASFVEILSISSLIPMIEILSNTENFIKKPFINNFFNTFEILDKDKIKFIIVTIFIFFVFLSYLFKIALIWISVNVSLKIGHDITMAVFNKTINQDYSYHLDKSSSRFLGNIEKSDAMQSFLSYFIQIINSLILLASIIIFCLYLSPYLIISSSLIIFSIYFLVYGFFKKIIDTNSKIYSNKINEKIKIVQESYINLREVIIKKLYTFFGNQFSKTNFSIIDIGIKNTLIANIPGNIILFITTVLLSIYIYFLSISENGLINNLSLLGALIFAAQKIITQAQFVYSSLTKIKTISHAYSDVEEILKLKIPTHNDESFDNQNNDLIFNKNIKFVNGYFKYKKSNEYVLDNINIEIKKNTLNIILGQSGAGKSTFVDLLIGLLKLSKGKIFIDEIELDKKNIKDWFKKISYVPQQINLIDGSILDNIIFGKKSLKDNYIDEIEEILKITNLFNFVKRLDDGLHTKLGENGIMISGGQKQRLAIARALFSNNEILIFDEATSSLDEENEGEIFDKIINKALNKTLIIISHRQYLTKRFNNIISIKDKKVETSKNNIN